jgi:hypothetical protein
MDTRKRGRAEGFINGSPKKHKQELDSLTSGIGTKSKPCTKFFSTSGCPFGEKCHFLHNVPGGYNAVVHLLGPGPAQPMRNILVAAPPRAPNGSSSLSVKSKLCSKYNTAEGCKFGEKCHFAHGEWELGKPNATSHDDPRHADPIPTRFGTHLAPSALASSATFGASATAKISVDASLAGAIIGKSGVNSKQICWQTGVQLSIRDHESDPNLRNIELEGTFEQIKEASAMVRELILRIGSSDIVSVGLPNKKRTGGGGVPPRAASNYKTKLCENFAKGTCTFGAKCHFAHGADEMRKSGV